MGDTIIEVNGKLTSVEPFAKLLPTDKKQQMQLKVLRPSEPQPVRPAALLPAAGPSAPAGATAPSDRRRAARSTTSTASTASTASIASIASTATTATTATAPSAAAPSAAAASAAAAAAAAAAVAAAAAAAAAPISAAALASAAARTERGPDRRCVECASASAPYPSAVCAACLKALTERKTTKGKYPGAGGFTSHGWNSFLLSPQCKGLDHSSFPSLETLGTRLYPVGYKDSERCAPPHAPTALLPLRAPHPSRSSRASQVLP